MPALQAKLALQLRIHTMSNTILFIDSNVSDYETLIAGLADDIEVHLLNATDDGVLQMANFLEGRSGLDSIQIVSHGSSGSLSLGSSVLNSIFKFFNFLPIDF